MPTDYGFTGQRRDASAGLMDYGARFYDPGLGRFTQPDTIVPDSMDPQSLNRYSYVLNNPVRYTDPTGHMMDDDDGGGGGGGGGSTDTEHASEEDTIVVTPENANNYYDPPAGDEDTKHPHADDDDVESGEKATQCLQDPACIIDVLIPSHGGIRGEFSGGFGAPVFGLVGLGPNVTLGANLMCNRHSMECGGSVDIGVQLAVQGFGGGGSVTLGPTIGWAAKSLAPILSGYSATAGGEGCVFICGESSVSIPLTSGPGPFGIEIPTGIYGDPSTGFIPATIYIGGGFGGAIPEGARAVGGVGGGASFSWAEIVSILPK